MLWFWVSGISWRDRVLPYLRRFLFIAGHRPRKGFESEGAHYNWGWEGESRVEGLGGEAPWSWNGMLVKIWPNFSISHFAVMLFTAFHSNKTKRSTVKIFTHEKWRAKNTVSPITRKSEGACAPPPGFRGCAVYVAGNHRFSFNGICCFSETDFSWRQSLIETIFSIYAIALRATCVWCVDVDGRYQEWLERNKVHHGAHSDSEDEVEQNRRRRFGRFFVSVSLNTSLNY